MSDVSGPSPQTAGSAPSQHHGSWVYVVSLSLALIGLVLSSVCEKYVHAVVGHLLRDLAIATFVGVFLAYTFERLARESFHQQAEEERRSIAANVFHYVLSFQIPEDITTEIGNQILRSHFIRRNVTLLYTIEHLPNPGGPSLVRLKTTSTYTVVNLTGVPQEYRGGSFIEIPPVSAPEESRYLGATVSEAFNGVADQGTTEPPPNLVLGERHLAKSQKTEEGHVHITLPGIVIPARQAIKVSISSSSVKLLDNGHVYYVFVTQTSGVNVRVSAPADVEVSARAYHPSELKNGIEHNPMIHNLSHWIAQRPFLAYQGIDVNWKRKPEPPHT